MHNNLFISVLNIKNKIHVSFIPFSYKNVSCKFIKYISLERNVRKCHVSGGHYRKYNTIKFKRESFISRLYAHRRHFYILYYSDISIEID